MYIGICDTVQEIKYEQWLKEWDLLPHFRKKKAASYHFLIDRVLSTKAYLLLKEGLESQYGIQGNPEFIYTPNGKPLLKDYPQIHFNLSHCPKGVLCVIDDKAVACDIEQISALPSEDVLNLCFNDDEKHSILSSNEAEIEFAKLWTIKEAIVKLSGEGLDDNLRFLLKDKDLSAVQTVVNRSKSYVYSIVSETACWLDYFEK